MLLPRAHIPEFFATAFPEPLLVHRGTGHDRRLDIGDQWNAGLDRPSAHLEAIRHAVGIHGVWDVDHEIHLPSLEQGQHVGFLRAIHRHVPPKHTFKPLERSKSEQLL